MTTSARLDLMAHFLAAARSPRQPFTLAGTGTGSCRLPALVVDVDQAATVYENIAVIMMKYVAADQMAVTNIKGVATARQLCGVRCTSSVLA